MYPADTYLPSDLACLEGWGSSFFVFDGLESSGGAWTEFCAGVSGNFAFLFGSPLFLPIIGNGENEGWAGQNDWVGWDDGVGQDKRGAGCNGETG